MYIFSLYYKQLKFKAKAYKTKMSGGKIGILGSSQTGPFYWISTSACFE